MQSEPKPQPFKVPLGNLRCFRDAVEALARRYETEWAWQHHEARNQAESVVTAAPPCAEPVRPVRIKILGAGN
jgi:hypothetical protein